ncbi:hypothetical protein CEXT_27351 [Caerostris extrusa]|uniref:Uncharacterized protein n=1 Tax=Caerostris extrusa TaxID=172846 RepID=A0AAV4X1Q5_CAEEX|nr:hypothetical protein CEXT_27351 [Caerostris extrusa]
MSPALENHSINSKKPLGLGIKVDLGRRGMNGATTRNRFSLCIIRRLRQVGTIHPRLLRSTLYAQPQRGFLKGVDRMISSAGDIIPLLPGILIHGPNKWTRRK